MEFKNYLMSQLIFKFPFKTKYVEDSALSKMIEQNYPDIFDKFQEGLQTKINERPYVSFVDPLKGTQ